MSKHQERNLVLCNCLLDSFNLLFYLKKVYKCNYEDINLFPSIQFDRTGFLEYTTFNGRFESVLRNFLDKLAPLTNEMDLFLADIALKEEIRNLMQDNQDGTRTLDEITRIFEKWWLAHPVGVKRLIDLTSGEYLQMVYRRVIGNNSFIEHKVYNIVIVFDAFDIDFEVRSPNIHIESFASITDLQKLDRIAETIRINLGM